MNLVHFCLAQGLPGQLLCVIVFEADDARDAVFDQGHVEVDQQAKPFAGQTEIRLRLRLVDWGIKSTDLISTITLSSMTRSALNPVSIRTLS